MVAISDRFRRSRHTPTGLTPITAPQNTKIQTAPTAPTRRSPQRTRSNFNTIRASQQSHHVGAKHPRQPPPTQQFPASPQPSTRNTAAKSRNRPPKTRKTSAFHCVAVGKNDQPTCSPAPFAQQKTARLQRITPTPKRKPAQMHLFGAGLAPPRRIDAAFRCNAALQSCDRAAPTCSPEAQTRIVPAKTCNQAALTCSGAAKTWKLPAFTCVVSASTCSRAAETCNLAALI